MAMTPLLFWGTSLTSNIVLRLLIVAPASCAPMPHQASPIFLNHILDMSMTIMGTGRLVPVSWWEGRAASREPGNVAPSIGVRYAGEGEQ